MATKHSFAAKLTAQEYDVLRTFNSDWRGADHWLADHLAGRGLLQRGQSVDYPDAILFAKTNPATHGLWREDAIQAVKVYRYLRHDYRLSKRGELMLQRYRS